MSGFSEVVTQIGFRALAMFIRSVSQNSLILRMSKGSMGNFDNQRRSPKVPAACAEPVKVSDRAKPSKSRISLVSRRLIVAHRQRLQSGQQQPTSSQNPRTRSPTAQAELSAVLLS
jgi:hypothetical protein